jgi:DNA-binding transcriptional MocR family regulator
MMGRPQGGFFASIRLDVCIEEHSLIQAAKEEGLILSSGNAFFADTPRYRFVRLPFCAMQHEEIVEGIKRLSLVVQKLSPPSAGKAAKARGGVLSQLLQ